MMSSQRVSVEAPDAIDVKIGCATFHRQPVIDSTEKIKLVENPNVHSIR
jgi:hypothetical protein